MPRAVRASFRLTRSARRVDLDDANQAIDLARHDSERGQPGSGERRRGDRGHREERQTRHLRECELEHENEPEQADEQPYANANCQVPLVLHQITSPPPGELRLRKGVVPAPIDDLATRHSASASRD